MTFRPRAEIELARALVRRKHIMEDVIAVEKIHDRPHQNGEHVRLERQLPLIHLRVLLGRFEFFPCDRIDINDGISAVLRPLRLDLSGNVSG